MKPLCDVKAAAELLAVSVWTVRAWIRQGKLRPIRIGRLVRLDEEELSKFVASSKAAGNGLPSQDQFQDSEPERKNRT